MDAFTFTGQVDSKGRVTVPAEIRDRLGIERGDEVRLELSGTTVLRREVDRREAVEIVDSLDAEEFTYSRGVLEVVLNE
ncbi:MAG: AbrB/MazE/SpoVT family DNA-binding domain-containing protein [Candidatus Nanohaloarchaea archaeon]